jgi:thioredoxin-dependent peroxiredoxin
MIDPLKATKGRRMSKKTRKKTAKTSSKDKTSSRDKAASPRGKSARSVKTSGKTSGKTSNKTSTTKPSPAANKSGKARKSAGSPKVTAAAPRPAARKATAAKTGAQSPSATKPQRPKAASAAVGTSPLAEGARAPAFHLPRDGGQAVSLADFSGQKLVLFFYPRADTPGCTKEAIDFTRLKSKFAESRTAVLGVSADPPKTQEAFRDKHQLSIPLVSDEPHEMLDAYGAWGEKSMYGRTFQGILRTTVLIGADGRIIKIWRHVKVDGHADEVLAAAQAAN